MNNLFLFGKKYMDTIMFVEENKSCENNSCVNIIQKYGGIFNFKEAMVKNYNLHFITSGKKKAYIVSDRQVSQRTSYVFNSEDAELNAKTIDSINSSADWLHGAYIDDLECYADLKKITKPFSIDFCTDKLREEYIEIMEKSRVIFDSRERKHLYKNIPLDTPIVFHDEHGIEVVKQGLTVYEKKITPTLNLDVNGAGDIYAAIFLDNYSKINVAKSALIAMNETTKTLINRNKK